MNELKLQEAILRAAPRLALGMMHKLSIHAGKGPWSHVSIGDLVHGLDEEVQELKAALVGGGYSEILDECADVANYCLMIADYAAQLGEELHLPTPPTQVVVLRCPHQNWASAQCIKPRDHGDGHAFPA